MKKTKQLTDGIETKEGGGCRKQSRGKVPWYAVKKKAVMISVKIDQGASTPLISAMGSPWWNQVTAENDLVCVRFMETTKSRKKLH